MPILLVYYRYTLTVYDPQNDSYNIVHRARVLKNTEKRHVTFNYGLYFFYLNLQDQNHLSIDKNLNYIH